jgi:tRNA(fMet)-specific endonuclease VapC
VTSETHVGLLDTSVIINLENVTEASLPRYSVMSAISLAELTVGPQVATGAEVRDRRQLVLQYAEATLEVLPFDDACARRFASVASSLRTSGSKSRARGFDALIASTALAYGVPLFTGNPRDFMDIPDLDVRPVASSSSQP